MKKVLIVDDMVSMRKILGLYLSTRGFQTIFAASANNAIEKLKAEKADIVITDLNMPDTDGISFTRNIRALPDIMSVPVLMLTSEKKEEIIKEAYAAGVTEVMHKPVTGDQLAEKINHLLKK